MTFSQFEIEAHDKRVARFVKYINATGRAPNLDDVTDMFGFCQADAKPILADAIVALAADKPAEAGAFEMALPGDYDRDVY